MKSNAVYTESLANKIKNIKNFTGRVFDVVAPNTAGKYDKYKKNIKYILGLSPAEQKSLMSSLPIEFINNTKLKSKYQLDRKPEFDILGLVDPNNESKGYKITFKGTAKLKSGQITTIPGDHYIIVKMNGSEPQTDGKLYSLSQRNKLIENYQNVYSQKNLIFESKKLVDLFCK